MLVSIVLCFSLNFLNVAAEKTRVLSTEAISTCLHYSDFKDSRVCVSFELLLAVFAKLIDLRKLVHLQNSVGLV